MPWYWPFKRAASDQPALPASTDPPPVEVAKALLSPTSSGVGGFTPSVTPPPETKPAGGDGVTIIGGFVTSRERSPALAGAQKWITYDNQLLNVAIVAAAVNIWTQLAGSAKWTVEPNKRGGKDAQRAADLVTQGLLEAQLGTPWRQVVRRQVMKKFRGFAMHEVILRRNSDGMVAVGDIQERPQWTIWRWNRPDPQASWIGVEQMTQAADGRSWYIPRERLFYSVENTLSASPEGVGLLRQTAESTRVLDAYLRYEGIGLQTDLRGIPSAKAPLQDLVNAARTAGKKTDAEIRSYVQNATADLVNFLANHNKDERQGILLDSASFKDNQGNPTGTPQWGFELVSGSSTSLGDVGAAIGRVTRDIARVMCAEWLLLGGEDSGGAYSMHEDKTAMFGLCVNSALDDVADDATRDIATRLVAMNGLDPETCTPKMVPEPIATGAVVAACQALATMAQAALDPRDKAINVLRGRLNLPPAPEVDEAALMLPQGAPEDVEGAPTEDDLPPDGGAPGNPNADPEATDTTIGKYAPEQPRGADGKWSSGSGGGGGSPRPWTLAFDDRDHQRVIGEHRQAESDHRAKAADLKQQIASLRASGKGADGKLKATIGRKIERLATQHDQHRAAATAAREARQAAQAHMEAARAAHVAARRAESAARQDAQWDRVRQESDSMMAIGQHRIGGSDGHAAESSQHELPPVHHISESDTAAAMERASANLQRHSDSLRSRDEHAAMMQRMESQRRGMFGTGGSNVTPREEPKRTQSEWNLHDQLQRESRQASNDRAEARNRAAKPVDPVHAVSLPEAHLHRPSAASRLRSLFSHKRAVEIAGLDATEVAKRYEAALEDLRLDVEAELDVLEDPTITTSPDLPA